MGKNTLAAFNLPDAPGVYFFIAGTGKAKKVLYVGKATSLRDRVRSYFDDDLIATRGPRIVDMVTKADRVAFEVTPTVLEALVREATLIKKYHPSANSEGKDDKSFLYVGITQEDIPRVLSVRGKDIDFKKKLTHDGQKLRAFYGPFPSGAQLREALRLIRRIFPFFDTAKPIGAKSKQQSAKIEFNAQIRQYPRTVEKNAYRQTIRRVMLLLSGRGKELRASLEREMREAAKTEHFEEATQRRRELFALNHLQDVSLIKDDQLEQRQVGKENQRIEAYDTAHLGGTNAIGVMVVIEGGVPKKSAYRTFRIRGAQKNDDIASLKEILSRRLSHPEWPFPQAIIIDGGTTHKKAAEQAVADAGFNIPVAAVVKDERHRPREIIGARLAGVSETDAVLANSEAHRFSITKHRQARSKNIRTRI